jgi:uncharacterized protein (DUF58 family)
VHGKYLAVLTAAVVIAALSTGHVLLLRTAYVLAAVLLLSAALAWTSVRWVELHRHTYARRAEVGGLAEETIGVHNRGWIPKLWLEIRDESDLPGHSASRVISTLTPGQSRTWTVRTRCVRRGIFTLGPMTLEGGDPLGMFTVALELPRTTSFIVFPKTYALRGLELPTGYLSGGQVVRRRAQYTTTNVRGVRQYQPGDAFGRIHWPTTARRARLYTKEFELDPIADFWVIVDLDREQHLGEVPDREQRPVLSWMEPFEDEIDPTTEEYSVTAAASLARHFLGVGKSVGLIAYGQRRVVLRPDRGDRQTGKILSDLAVLRAVGRMELSELLSAEMHQFIRHTTLVIVTPSTSLRWIEALRELRYRGVASLVVLLQADTFGSAPSSEGVLSALASHAIAVRRLRRDDDIASALVGTSARHNFARSARG